MNIAACDYDGTLFRHGQVSREDLEAIKAWREQGHLFGLATGRDLNLSRSEIERYNIPYDFIVCNTGASVYGPDFIPLHLVSLPPPAVNLVFDHPETARSRYFLLSRAGQTYIYQQSPKSWLTSLGLPMEYVDEETVRSLTGIQQIGLEFDDVQTALSVTERYNRDLGPTLHAQNSSICVDLVAGGISKAEGLAIYMELQGLKAEVVVTLGDSENDLSMFERFRGYAMTASPAELKKAAFKVVDSPAEALWEYL